MGSTFVGIALWVQNTGMLVKACQVDSLQHPCPPPSVRLLVTQERHQARPRWLVVGSACRSNALRSSERSPHWRRTVRQQGHGGQCREHGTTGAAHRSPRTKRRHNRKPFGKEVPIVLNGLCPKAIEERLGYASITPSAWTLRDALPSEIRAQRKRNPVQIAFGMAMVSANFGRLEPSSSSRIWRSTSSSRGRL